MSHHLSPEDRLGLAHADDGASTTQPASIFEYAWKRLSFSYTDMDYESGPATFDASHFSVKYTSRH